MKQFHIYVDGIRVKHDVTYGLAKQALADALTIWKKVPEMRPEVCVRRADGARMVHRLPGGRYVRGFMGTWERAR